MNQRLTEKDVQEVVDKMKHHRSLVQQGNYKDARRIGPKVIAYEHGISPTYAYVLLKKHG